MSRTIESLEASEALRQTVTRLRTELAHATKYGEGQRATVLKLDAEVALLREALKQIDAEAACPAAEYVPALRRIWELARAALAGKAQP